METIFPQETGFSGIFLVGFRKIPPDTAQTQRVGTVVVKRNYTIVGSGLQPAADTVGIRIQDETQKIQLDINGDTEDFELVIHESDIAPYKPQGDLFVKGHVAGTANPASIRVNSTTWLSRPAVVPSCLLPEDEEIDRNLFGWEQRSFLCRLDDTGSNPRDLTQKGFSSNPADYPAEWNPGGTVPDFKDPLHPVGFSNRFYNAYKRGFKSLSGDFPFFQAGDEVELNRDPGGTHDSTITFELPDDQLNAQFFYYCGYGPDRVSRWCAVSLTLVKDTLVIEPSAGKAYILWRGVWDFDTIDEQLYRRLQVTLNE